MLLVSQTNVLGYHKLLDKSESKFDFILKSMLFLLNSDSQEI